jgi:hypothetical protein
MVFMRRRPLLRAAAVGGAGYLAGKGMARRQADQQSQEAGQDQRISSLEQQAAPASTRAAAPGGSGPGGSRPGGGPTMTDQLSQLTDMHAGGALSDAEFAAAKAKLLGT